MTSVKLQKFMAETGLCSRREAENRIREGRVEVDGETATIGDRIDPDTARVRVDGRILRPRQQAHRTLVVNKPRRCVCTHRDPHAERTVFDLVPPSLRDDRLLCAGRLDKDSEGLVVLSTDGDLVQRLAHPTGRIVKRYRVRVQRPLEEGDIPKLLRGRTVEGDWLQFDRVVLLPSKSHPGCELEVHLSHGRKREIRRLLQSFGYLVKRLERFQIGGYRLRGLARGQVRPLRGPEIKRLLAPPRSS